MTEKREINRIGAISTKDLGDVRPQLSDRAAALLLEKRRELTPAECRMIDRELVKIRAWYREQKEQLARYQLGAPPAGDRLGGIIEWTRDKRHGRVPI